MKPIPWPFFMLKRKKDDLRICFRNTWCCAIEKASCQENCYYEIEERSILIATNELSIAECRGTSALPFNEITNDQSLLSVK